MTTKTAPAAVTPAARANVSLPGGRAQDATRQRQVTTVAATAYPPDCRRRRWVLLAACPFCSGVHLHLGAQHGGVRRAACGRGRYLIRPSQAAAIRARRAA